MIEIKKARKIYKLEDNEVKALDGVDLRISAGEFVLILGQSGCGKSTLLNILGGMDRPTSGEVLIDDEDLAKKKPASLAVYRREKVGMIFQKFNLISDMTVLENVMLPLKFSGQGERRQRRSALLAIEQVGLKDKIKSVPSKLSGGQQQRVAIARALVNNPDILLCDEPTGNLDSKTGNEIMSLLSELNKKGTTVIVVTHNEQYSTYANHIIKMLDGKIVSEMKKAHKATVGRAANKSNNIGFWAGARLALKNVRRRKLRVFLTSFGIAIGAMAILVLVSFGAGLQNEATKQMKAFSRINEISVANTKITGADFRNGRGNFILDEAVPLNDKVIKDLAAIPNVKKVYPSVNIYGEIIRGDKTGRLNLTNTPPLSEDQSALKDMVKYGGYFSDDSENSIIVPYGLAEALGYAQGGDIAGQEVLLRSQPDGKELKAKVIGVFGEDEKNIFQTYIPSTAATNFLKQTKADEAAKDNPNLYDGLSVIAKDNASVSSIDQSIKDKGYATHSYADTAKEMSRTFVILQVGLGVVGGIAMLVAALGIINTMMMSILERIREIGVMKAVGAREKDIKFIFLIEAATIGLFGGGVGLLIGYPASRVASAIFNNMVMKETNGPSISFFIAPYLALGVLTFSVLVAVIAGYFPARRGAKMDPVIALRDE